MNEYFVTTELLMQCTYRVHAENPSMARAVALSEETEPEARSVLSEHVVETVKHE